MELNVIHMPIWTRYGHRHWHERQARHAMTVFVRFILHICHLSANNVLASNALLKSEPRLDDREGRFAKNGMKQNQLRYTWIGWLAGCLSVCISKSSLEHSQQLNVHVKPPMAYHRNGLKWTERRRDRHIQTDPHIIYIIRSNISIQTNLT